MRVTRSANRVPTVTVIVLCYNHGKLVAAALDSILKQRGPFQARVIVHDDASTDETPDVIRNCLKRYPDMVQAILRTENQFSKTGFDFLFSLIETSNADFIAFCEGDDFWISPTKIRDQIETLQKHPNCSACCHWAGIVRGAASKSVQIAEKRPTGFLKAEDLLYYNPIDTSTVLMRGNYSMSLVKALPRQPMGDWPLWIQLVLNGPIIALPETWSAYRQHTGALWSTRDRFSQLAACCGLLAAIFNLLPIALQPAAARGFAHHFRMALEAPSGEPYSEDRRARLLELIAAQCGSRCLPTKLQSLVQEQKQNVHGELFDRGRASWVLARLFQRGRS